MKAASLSLKVIAILAAAFSIYAWYDTRGKIATAETQMKGVAGATLQEKAPKIPGLLKDKADLEQKVVAFEGRVRTLEQRNDGLNSELESERAKSVQTNAEIVKKNYEIRNLNTTVASNQKQIAEKDALVETLKREIVSTKALLSQTNEADALKEKVATLQTQLDSKSKALTEAEKKIKVFETAEVVEVVETDAQGNKVVKKIVKTPYIPTGDMATVISANPKEAILVINRGESAGVKQYQKIDLKREGVLVAEIVVADSYADFSLGYMNPKVGIPETVEAGDVFEMASPAVEAPKEEVAPAAPAEEQAQPQQPAAPAAPTTNA